MDQPSKETVRQDLYIACQIIDRKGLTEGFGHVSFRFPGTDQVMIPPRRGPGLIQPEEMLVLDLEGNVVDGSGTPALEFSMHSQVYRRRPDVRAICRTHSPMVQVLSVLGRPIRPVHGFGAFLKTAPLFMTPFLITTAQLGDELAETLGDAEAVVMRGNGCLTVGRSIQEAVTKAVWLEDSARIQVNARAVGEPVYFSQDEIATRANVRYDVWRRAWEYWRERLVEGAR